jgi:ribosomal protein L18
MLNIFKRMLANMAAEAAMTNIFKPMMNQMAGSALGNMFGLPSVSGGGTTMFPSFSGMSNLPGMGWLGATIPGSTAIIGSELGWGAAAAQDIGVMASPGVTWGSALGAGALGSLGYSTLGSAIGLPTSGYSGITSGLGAAGMSAYGGSLAGLTGIGALGGPIGIGIGALAGGLLGGLFGGSDPTPTIQLKSGLRPDSGVYPGEVNSPAGFNYHTWLQDVGSRAEIGSAVTGYFDSLFIALDDATKFSVKDVLSSTSFLTRVDPNDYGGDMNAILAAMAEDIFGDLQESLEIALLGFDSSYIDLDFFEAIKVEGESLFNTFARFSSVVENTDNFMEEFNRRVDSLGQTPVEAYQQIQLVSGVLAEMDMAIAQITGSAVIGQINALSDTWNAYIDVMKQAQATAEQLTDAESKRNLVVGSQITGITTSSIAQALKSGSSVDAIVSKAMGDLVAEKMAQEMFDEMVPVVEEAGRIWSETGGNIDAVTDYLRSMGYQFEDTMSVFSDSMESARDALDAAIGKEEQLINARLDAADKIDTLLVDLMGGSQAPVQSMEFFERRYEQLLAEAQGATTAEEINSSVDALTGFVSQYLDFAGDYGGQDYNSLFNKITSDLKDIEYEQRSEAEKQISKLEEINSTLGIVADAALSLETAFSNFLSAQSEVVQAGYDEGLMPFADGGISTGPASGYPIMAHNTEAHVPIKNGSIPVEISRSGTIPNVNLKIFIGNKEIKDFQVEVINTDPEAQRAIRRVANG